MKTGENKHTYLTALEEYINNVYVLVLLLVPGACQCAGIVYTLEKAFGWLPSVSFTMLVIFDITCLLYLLIGIFLVKTGFRDGIVRKDKLKSGKIFIVLCMFIQFNFILYMIPSTDFWGFVFFFVILTSLFIDLKMVIAATVEIVGSLITNPVSEDIHFEDGFFPVSTKREKWHGLGLNNIKRVCDKYQGSMELCCKDKLFKLFISLNIHE